MRALFGSTTACAALVLALAACGGGGGDDDDDQGADGGEVVPDGGGGDPADAGAPDGGEASASLDDVCDLYVDLFSKLFECNPELAFLIGVLPDAGELDAMCRGSLADFLADGSEVLGSAADLAACRAYIEGTSCDLLDPDIPSACDGVIVGQVPTGGDCDSSEQCAGDAYCTEPNGEAACGECAPRLADDSECGDDDECSSRYCRPGDDATPGACATRAGVGEDCAGADDCIGRLLCDTDSESCVVGGVFAVGDPCDSGGIEGFIDQCGGLTGDLYCAPGAGECVAYLELDDPCGEFPEGGLCRVFDYETCQGVPGATVCTAGITVADGDECGFFQGRRCVNGSACRDHDVNGETPDQCVDLGGVGDPCVAGQDLCEPFLECVADACQYGEHTGMCPVD